MVQVAPSAAELAAAQDKTKPGVAFNPPPPSIMSSINKHIDAALVGVPAGKQGALVVGIDTTAGLNAAIVEKLDKDGDWTVTGWIGKKWGEPISAGVYGRGSW